MTENCPDIVSNKRMLDSVASKSGVAMNGISYYGKPRIARSGGSWL